MKSDLNRISETFRKAIEVRDATHTPSLSEGLSLNPDKPTAFAVEEVDPPGWIKIQSFNTSDFRPGDAATGNFGWIQVESDATQFLHQRMPELEFVNGVIGYLRVYKPLMGCLMGQSWTLHRSSSQQGRCSLGMQMLLS